MTGDRRVGLALGGGLARGLAHIGVLKALEEAGIGLSHIAGTSMGSVIGALYACGLNLKMIGQLAERISRRTWMDLTFPRKGLIAGERLEELVHLLTAGRSFSELTVPLAVVAVDLISGEKVVISEGSVARAVRASCAIPGIFSPVKVKEKVLVDGGVLQRVPASVVREMGAELVIAVDVGTNAGDYKLDHIIDVLSRSVEIMSRKIHQAQKKDADLLVAPAVDDIGSFDFHRVEEVVCRGETAMHELMPLLVNFLKEG